MSALILLTDNYDSFAFNLVRRFRVLGAEVRVYRNDEISLDQASSMDPTHLVISPGPGNPDDAGISVDAIRAFERRIPVLGVCLGHQSIVAAYGGAIVPARCLMHGKTSAILHDGRGLFRDLERPFVAMRYHSLVVEPASLPELERSNIEGSWPVRVRVEVGERLVLRHPGAEQLVDAFDHSVHP